jgi:hypothetical protein
MKGKPTITRPTPVLQPDTIYAADNGDLICLKCAGMTAKYAGLTLDGDKVVCISRKSRAAFEWYQEFGKPLSCRGECTTYPVPKPEPKLALPEWSMPAAFA